MGGEGGGDLGYVDPVNIASRTILSRQMQATETAEPGLPPSRDFDAG